MTTSVQSASILIGVLLGIYSIHQVKGDRLALRIGHEPPFCSKRCEVEQLTAAPDVNVSFPLYQCSCSRSCAVFGDCCYDSPYKNARSWQKTEFICLSVVGHGQYRAVSSCSSGRLSDFCKDGLGNLPPVTSRVTNVTYANRFCAICNEDGENLVAWNVQLRCSTDANFEANGDGTTRYIYQSGDIYSLNEKDGSKTLCKYHVHFNDTSFMKGLGLRTCSHIKKISSCAASWENLDVLKKCKSYEDPVFFRDRAYQNAHCAECNYMDIQSMECVPLRVKILVRSGVEAPDLLEFCRSRGLEECIRSLAVISKGGWHALSDMFFTSERLTCVPPPGRRCCRGEIYKHGKCRALLK